jgi:hypothetical protein
MRIRTAVLSLREIAASAHVPRGDERIRVGRVVLVSITSVLLAPVAALAGLVLLTSGEAPHRLRRFFYDSGRLNAGDVENHDEPRDVDVLTFSSNRAWWLCDGDDPARVPLALMLDAGSDEFVLLGVGWPEKWTNRRSLFARWVVYRSRPDGRVLGVRAWGRCPIRREIVATEAVDVDDRAVVRTRASLSAPLSRLVSASSPYR